MGFGSLLHFVDMMLPRNLCYWLMTRVDPQQRMFVASDGREFPLSPLQVEWVLGTPVGQRRIPMSWEGGTAMDNKVKAIMDKYGTMKIGRRWPVIVLEKAIKIVEGEGTSDDEKEEFTTAFLIFALATVLCPTTCTNLATHLLPAATLTEDCREYDWSSLVLEHLLQSAKSFHRKFQQKGAVSGCGGCTIFLAVFYLDRLNKLPVLWGDNPRIKVWRFEEIKKARIEDRHQGGDFGKLGTIDVAYGDERHPKVARDTRMKTGADDVDEVEASLGSDADESEVILSTRKRRRGRTNNKNPNEWKKEKSEKEASRAFERS